MSLDDMMLREEIAKAIEAIPLGEDNAQLNAVGYAYACCKSCKRTRQHF
jgi:hypothetical protein